ncbi:Organic hydroperoxide resistance protein [Minicystis rosea]|nr:Organic hydroperoxide resistance protein [Minicystis rosea]
MKPLYTAVATAEGGRTGHVRSSDGVLDLDLRMPKELGGPGGTGTNPEQLFAAGYSACFESALRLVARQKKLAIEKATITAHVTIGATEGGGFGLAAELHASVTGPTKEQVEELIHAAHQVCPYSLATRGNIEVKLVVD